MRQSLHDIERLEAYIKGQLGEAETQEVQAQLLLHPTKYGDMLAQRQAYALIRASGRRQLKAELKAIHISLQRDPNKKHWWKRIQGFFVD